ncbi:DUF2809 domain-containing protein [Dysgonomonas sp. ZJ279]|uniref:ribosomal maturation YjgA family protein n=1 Tax=Dysgonomonas sp. ZJ279 TaxID=2709796 RepID=UPI0016236CDC|nr:DUF2809 domain-containing protein [Dysgonomonas sp. ZJ279]
MGNTGNKLQIRFDFRSFVVFLIIFAVEVVIALFVDDKIIRPYGGDILVVILIYYFVKSFIRIKSLYLVIGVLLFAYAVEIGQYFRLVEVLGMQNNKVMRVVIGSTFTWGDTFSYTLGVAICYFIDRKQTDLK